MTIAITFEQPAIAARIQWTGVGEAIPVNSLNVSRLREAVQQVLRDEKYAGLML